ncbi:hypothetical protein GCM10011611_47300 [Aliidongia dinghuensis]|uniref:histidine kinase n=1 Tax=Aliidongia dinghuensis TaxID=1867774 RepID=A0A8J2YY28_9PROT|nr:ATP-binding protein [Aliidongia dinghuensis]GGF35501.1 hypothetical protein GCM10011611_47300 [Aliidongia dinghuensis]
MLKPLKLRTSIVLIFGGLAFLTVALVALVVGNGARSLAEHDARLRLEAAAVTIRNELDQDLAERFRDIRNGAALSPLFAEGNTPIRRAWFDRVLATYPDYAWLGFAGLDGTVVTSANGVLEGQSVVGRPWFTEGLKAPFIGDVHAALLLEQLLPNPSGEPMRFIDLAAPVANPSGQIVGVLGAHLSWQWARRLQRTVLASADDGRQGIEAFILDRGGRVLLGPEGFLDKPLALPGLAPPAAKPESALVSWPDAAPYLTSSVGTEAHADFPGLGWSVTVRQPRSLAFAEAQAIQRRVLWLSLAAALLAGGIAWLLADRLARPLTRLSEAAQRIRKGEPDVTLPRPSGYFETASLARSIHTMTATLERQRGDLAELNATLEARIAQRTAALNLMQEVAAAANEARDLDAAVRFGLARLTAFLGWPVGHAHRIITAPDGRFEYVATELWQLGDTRRFAPFVAATQELVFGEGDGLPGRVVAEGAPVWVSDVRMLPGFLRRAAAETCGLGAALAVPVKVGDRIELILQCFADRPLEADAEGLSVARFVGQQLSRVAERLAAAAHLAEREARLSAVYDSVLDGILTIDPSGAIETMNRAAERLFGHPAGSLVQRNMRLLLAEPSSLVSEEGEFALGTVRELEGIRADGSRFPMELAVTAADVDDRPLRVVSVRDISERRAIERLKNEFVSTVSHELRTPLTSISGALALMAKGTAGALPDKAQSLVAIARSNCDRLVRLINDILDLERIEAGRLVFEFGPVDLVELLDDAARETADFAQQYDVTLTVARSMPEAIVWGDRHRLMQVVGNLVSNAIKFSPAGSTVTLDTVRAHGRVRVAVIDEGRGIPDAFKATIFQKFAQADASDSRQKGGTGLGLSIVKSIVERHGGTVGFSSRVRAGSIFWFELPERLDTSTADEPWDVAPSPRVLVCEDDEDAGRILALHLERAGYEPVVTRSAAEARDRLRRGGFAAMTLDIGLPDGDGLALLHEIKADPATADMPVVVVSGRPEAGRDRLGIADWLEKPVIPERLIAALDQVVEEVERPAVLHVEDDPDIAGLVAATLGAGTSLTSVGSLAEARRALAQAEFDVVLLDVGLPDGSGLELLDTLDVLTDRPKPSVILFSAQELHPDRRDEMAAVLVKSQANLDRLAQMIEQALSRRMVATTRSASG